MKIKTYIFFLFTRLLKYYLTLKKEDHFISAFRWSLKAKSFAKLPEDGNVTEIKFGSIPCEIIEPTTVTIKEDRVLVYFHGGGFIGGDLDSHRDPVYSIAKGLGVKAINVDYSTAPEVNYPAPFEEATLCINEISKNTDYKEIIIAGDSAGGLIALNSVIKANDELKSKIVALYLISPWLDTTNKLAVMSGNNRSDQIMSLHFLSESAKVFFGDKKPINFLDKLDYNCLNNLKIAYINTGKNELLTKDSEALVKKLNQYKIPNHFSFTDKMGHAFTICAKFIDESQIEINQATFIINKYLECK